MAIYSTSEFRSGLKILLDGQPCVILENEFVKPGKGQAFNRVKIKNLKTGNIWDKTFRSGESVAAADVSDMDMQFLYYDGEAYHFMHPTTFEQYIITPEVIGDTKKWLRPQDMCIVTLWNNIPILISPPNFVDLKIVETDPGMRGDTSGGGNKPATLETGAVVKVPLFIQNGEIIKVDTRDGIYVSRSKS